MMNRLARGARAPIAFALALIASAATAPDANAGPLSFSYSSTGVVGSAGVNGADAIGVNSVASTDVGNTGTYRLGEFSIAKLGAGKSTTYMNTPFHLTLLSPDLNPLKLTGTINGTIDGDGMSKAVAKFDMTKPYTFDAQGATHTLNLPKQMYELANNTRVPIDAAITFGTPVPEPASVLVLAAGVLGYALRRRLRRAA